MKTDLVDDFFSPVNDTNFFSKFLLSLGGSFFFALFAGAPILFGYMAKTVAHAIQGKSGLPDLPEKPWDMALEGTISLLSALYCLPGAILVAFSLFIKLNGEATNWLSVSGMLANFILCGGVILLLLSLAFTSSSLYGYVSTKELKEIFDLSKVIARIRQHVGEIVALLIAVGAVYLLIALSSIILPRVLTAILAIASSAYLSLVFGLRTGNIFKPDPQDSHETAAKSSEAEGPKAVSSAEDEEGDSLEDESNWVPK